jgi:hypothetical protein
MNKIISLFLLSLLILECTFSENTEAGNLAKVFREMDRNGNKKITFKEVSTYV